MAVNRVVYNGRTLIDLTSDTVTADQLKSGATAHDKSGNVIVGEYEGIDISEETAVYTSELDAQDDIIDQIAAVLESQFAVPSKLQVKTITPSTSEQIVTADGGYEALSTVTVEAIPQSYTNQIYQNGYNEGNEVGYSSGYNEGNEVGYSSGYDTGYKSGKLYKTELEFIESTGTQYINTEYLINENTEIDLVFEISGYVGDTWNGIFGGRTTQTSSDTLAIFTNKDVGSLAINHAGMDTGPITGSIITGTRILTTNIGDFYQNDNLIYTFTGSVTTGVYPCYIFAANLAGVPRCSKIKFTRLGIKERGIMMRDFIPVLDWDDIPCLYDRVGRKLYYNAGTGDFIVGAVKAA